MDNMEMIETADQKLKTIFMGTFFTLFTLLISVSYGMTWGILFLIFTTKKEYNEVCGSILSWDKVLIVVQFISAGLHLVSSIFQLIASSYNKQSNIPKLIMGIRSCLVYLAGMSILIGINVAYFANPGIDKCEELATLNLAYIITEWTLLGFCICFVCVVCIASLIFKKKKN